MSTINPIGPGPLPPIAGSPTLQKPETTSAGSNFGDLLRGCIDRVEQDQSGSAQAVQDLLAGKSQDILPAATMMAKADMSFKLLMSVRNKVIEAYKQTMNMQV